MAKLMKCTKCPFHIDISSIAPGTVIECPNCAVQVRVPTGQTGKFAAVSAEPKARASAAPAKSGKGRTTAIFRKMANADPLRAGARELVRDRAGARSPKNNPGLIVGVVAGVVVLIAGILFAMNAGKNSAAPAKKADEPIPASRTPVPQTNPIPATKSTPPEVANNSFTPPNPRENAQPKTASPDDASQITEDWMRDLKSPAVTSRGANPWEYTEDNVGYRKFRMLQNMGDKCYPYLMKHLDNEDTMIGRAAGMCLRILTKKEIPLPKSPEHGKEVRKQWQNLLGIKD